MIDRLPQCRCVSMVDSMLIFSYQWPHNALIFLSNLNTLISVELSSSSHLQVWSNFENCIFSKPMYLPSVCLLAFPSRSLGMRKCSKDAPFKKNTIKTKENNLSLYTNTQCFKDQVNLSILQQASSSIKSNIRHSLLCHLKYIHQAWRAWKHPDKWLFSAPANIS